MSQTHVLVAAALLARPGERLRNTAVLAGSIVPDAAIYVLFGWSKVAGIAEREVWGDLYWRPPWSDWVAAGNSVFVYGGLLLAGFFLLRAVPGAFRIGVFLTLFALAAFSHLALDFPVHHADAHRHLWPFSDWVFRSPVSYWDPAHHGGVFIYVEAALGLLLCVVLFRRFHAMWARACLGLLALAYVVVPVYFSIVFRHQ